MLGREITMPVDLLLQPVAPTSDSDPATYVEELRERLQNIHQCARRKLADSLESRKRNYDRKAYRQDYDKGDLVYVLNSVSKKGQSKKRQPIYLGPYLIVSKISDCLFVVINNRGKRQVLHHDRLRCCHDNNVPLWARRERRKLEAESTEGGEDGNDVLAEEDMDVSTLFEHAEARPATSSSNDVPEQGGQRDEPAPSQELMAAPVLPPSHVNGRQRQQPAWLRDCITHRGTLRM